MLLILPLVFFGLAGILLGALRVRGMRMAYLWLLPVILSLVCWVIFLILPIPATASVTKIPGLFSLAGNDGLTFILDDNSWGFIYLVVSLVLGYFLTMVIRLDQEKRTWLWMGWLLLCMAAILSFSAGNLITLILAWVVFDLLDFLFSYFILKISQVEESQVEYFPARVISIVLLIAAGVFLPVETPQWLPSPLAPAAYFLLFLAALFRTGLLPFQPVDQKIPENGNSFLFSRRILLALTGFSLFSFLPTNYLNSISQILLSIFFLFLTIFFVILLFLQNRFKTNLWLNSIICLGCISVISGTPIALLGWAGVAILGTGIPRFFTHRSHRLKIIALLGVLSLSGLPYSIGAFALAGLTNALSWLWLILVLPVYALLLYRFIDSIQQPVDDSPAPEPIFLTIYLIGIFIMAFATFAILVKNAPLAANVLNYWWAGIAVVALCPLFHLINKRIPFNSVILERISISMDSIKIFITFEWLKKIWQWLAWLLSGIIRFLTQLLSGEGGVIWAIVMLVLLVSLISVGRS